jgi:hypothetical protein
LTTPHGCGHPLLEWISLSIQLGGTVGPFIKAFDNFAPRLALAVVDLALIQHLSLHDLAAGAAFAQGPELLERYPNGRNRLGIPELVEF